MISLNLAEPIPSILNLITEVIKAINLNKEREIQKISIKQSELDSELKKISIRHKVLATEIFYPICQNIVSIDISETNLPTITFTASQVRDSLHYDDGLEHLNRSIPNFFKRFSEIENKVIMYNTDLDEFHKNRLEKYVSDNIERNGFNVTYNSNTNVLPNTINLSNLFPKLKQYWFREIEDIPINLHGNSMDVSMMGHAQIASIRNDIDKDEKYEEENKIRNLVNELKEMYEIKTEFNKFYGVIIDIHKMVEELRKDIGKNIIKFIDLNEYNDICEICNQSHVS
jgi:hypothetical protein